MKNLIIVGILVFCVSCSEQDDYWDAKKLSEYFTLKCVQNKFKYENKDTIILSVYPALTEKGTGKISNAFRDKDRRFEYLLQNYTSFKGKYDALYPDTIQIQKFYIDTLANNKLFIKYLKESLRPFEEEAKPSTKYSKAELLNVASRFFYCNKVMPDTSIYWNVCIGLNGVRDANWDKDYALLEAFCFEAIFNYLEDPSKAGFMNNFITHTEELKDKFISENKTTEGLLEYVRLNTFKKMASEILIQRLNEYYELNKSNLSFEIL